MSIHQSGPFVAWLIATLEAGGVTVGDAVRPADADDVKGYAVIYPIPGGSTSGAIDDPRSDATVAVQITSSSTDPRQCRWVADRVRSLLNEAVPAMLSDGRRVIFGEFPDGGPAVNRDDRVQNPRYFTPDRFEFGTA